MKVFFLSLLLFFSSCSSIFSGVYTTTNKNNETYSLEICDNVSPSIGVSGRMNSDEGNTTYFLDCIIDDHSLECQWFDATGMWGDANFQLVGSKLSGYYQFNPLSHGDYPIYNFEFAWNFLKVSQNVECSIISGEQRNWDGIWRDVNNDGLVLYMCSDREFVSISTPSHKAQIYAMKSTYNQQILGGFWFHINSKDEYFGSVMIVRNNVQGDRITLYTYSDEYLSEGLNITVYELYQEKGENITLPYAKCVYEYTKSQALSGKWKTTYKDADLIFHVLSMHDSVYGFFEGNNNAEQSIGFLVGKVSDNGTKAIGNFYSPQYWVHKQNLGTFSISINEMIEKKTAFGVFTFTDHLIPDASPSSSSKDNDMIFGEKERRMVLGFLGPFTTHLHSMALLGYEHSTLSGSYYGGYITSSVEMDFGLCKKNDSDACYVSYNGYNGYMEGISYENGKLMMASYVDQNKNRFWNGVYLFLVIHPLYAVAMHGESPTYGNSEVLKWYQDGVFRYRTKPSWKRCHENQQFVPFSPLDSHSNSSGENLFEHWWFYTFFFLFFLSCCFGCFVLCGIIIGFAYRNIIRPKRKEYHLNLSGRKMSIQYHRKNNNIKNADSPSSRRRMSQKKRKYKNIKEGGEEEMEDDDNFQVHETDYLLNIKTKGRRSSSSKKRKKVKTIVYGTTPPLSSSSSLSSKKGSYYGSLSSNENQFERKVGSYRGYYNSYEDVDYNEERISMDEENESLEIILEEEPTNVFPNVEELKNGNYRIDFYYSQGFLENNTWQKFFELKYQQEEDFFIVGRMKYYRIPLNVKEKMNEKAVFSIIRRINENMNNLYVFLNELNKIWKLDGIKIVLANVNQKNKTEIAETINN